MKSLNSILLRKLPIPPAEATSLFNPLVQASDSIDVATDLAFSPIFSTAPEAVFEDATFDSTAFSMVASSASAELTRAQFVLCVAGYLEHRSDPLTRQQAQNVADEALAASTSVKSELDNVIPGTLGIPAGPLLRFSSTVLPDSVDVGGARG